MTLYENLAEAIETRIRQGLYRPGDRLPSVRSLGIEHGVSLSTVQQAYRVLEDKRLAVPRAKSGYYVPETRQVPELPQATRGTQRPVDVSQWEQVLDLMSEEPSEHLTQFGRGRPDIDSPTLKPLTRALSRFGRQQSLSGLTYGSIQGNLQLREQIARLMLDSGCQTPASELIITNGCHEALSTAIRALCVPGDVVAVDSPAFHGVMQALKGFGLKALELPTDPIEGISLEALEMALEQWPIKVLQLTPSCNNPLGYSMPDHKKRALLALAQRYDLAIIEDDVYGDLAYRYPRPRTIKSFDEDGRVLLCSSFSKSIAPGLRTGWIAPGRYYDQVLHMKYMGSGPTATLPQLAMSAFIEGGHFDPHLRRMRHLYQRSRDQMIEWVGRYFPENAKASRPEGSFMLWVELEEGFDSLRLNKLLRPKGIQIAPGSIFSAAGKYRNCLRMSYAARPTPQIEAAVREVGEVAKTLLTSHD
ncbi:aminotransferase-like domain-containing protein [Pseudomonas matsuisoli]|uniref:GntR family transcriptional regulator n=1 Tax=Pseudomonas matsuisoli TaxID=1515666 RepID=A0A917UYJ7_9PSED|nr:PLP-dependent aminotransferase family protein [Pseudomonas matsuisoli]GGJ96776.1 GntR family transcriptional regulator [Pseudomonas matsuisoli]